MDYAVTVFPKENKGNMKASAILSLGQNDFVITNIKVLEGKNGLFIAMPSVKENGLDENGNDKYHEIAFPITKEFREELTNAVIKAYNSPKHVYFSSPSDKLKEAPEVSCRVNLREGNGNFKGFASIQLGESLMVRDVRVVAKDGGKPFFYYPSFTYQKNGKEEEKQYAFPKSKAFGSALYAEMSKAYETALGEKNLESVKTETKDTQVKENDAFGLGDELPFEIKDEPAVTPEKKKKENVER